MRALLPAAVAIAVCLAGFAAGIAAGDRQLFVPPPESVAEGFVRQLAARRYDRARPLLSERAAARHDVAALAGVGRMLEEAAGEIAQVAGIAGVLQSDTARASARVHGRSGDIAVAFDLVRERGLWRIEGWAAPTNAPTKE